MQGYNMGDVRFIKDIKKIKKFRKNMIINTLIVFINLLFQV